MKNPEKYHPRTGIYMLLATLFFLSACSSQTKSVEPTYLIQYKLVACQETDIVNYMCDDTDQRLPFTYEVYAEDRSVATTKPNVNNGEVLFTNQEYPGGHSIPMDQKSNGLCLTTISNVETFPEQLRFDLIFEPCP